MPVARSTRARLRPVTPKPTITTCWRSFTAAGGAAADPPAKKARRDRRPELDQRGCRRQGDDRGGEEVLHLLDRQQTGPRAGAGHHEGELADLRQAERDQRRRSPRVPERRTTTKVTAP